MRQAAAPIFAGPMGPGVVHYQGGPGLHSDIMDDTDPTLCALHEHLPPGAVCPRHGVAHGGGWQDEFMQQHSGAPVHHFDPLAPIPTWAEELATHTGHETVIPPGPLGEGGESSWLDQFEGSHEVNEWVEDFTTEDTKCFGVEGEVPLSVEEKRANSEFYRFLAKVNTGAIQFDEHNQIIENPNAAPDFASEFMVQQERDGLLRGTDNDEVDEVDEMYGDAWDGGDGMLREYLQGHGVGNGGHDDAERWMEEFQKMNLGAQNQNDAEYPFEENNPYLFHDTPYEEGVALLQAGTLAAAALAFEAACQKDAYHVEAWMHLGTTQQENEKDPLAILALKKVRELDPMNLPAYMALAVSFTNEAQHSNALATLKDWLLHHPEYSTIHPPPQHPSEENEFLNDYFYVNPKDHKEISAMYEEATRRNPQDAEVYVALGIIHNLSHEYDLAATDFEKALQVNPNDPKLWNKLGATLANGSRPREAIAAYNRALDLVPGYVRAQYNMGISLSNLGEYADAVRQFLKALHMQQDGVQAEAPGGNGGPTDSSLRAKYTREIWDVLRMTLHLMDRNDLVELTLVNDIKTLSMEFGLTLV